MPIFGSHDHSSSFNIQDFDNSTSTTIGDELWNSRTPSVAEPFVARRTSSGDRRVNHTHFVNTSTGPWTSGHNIFETIANTSNTVMPEKTFQIVTHGDGSYSIRAVRFTTHSEEGVLKFMNGSGVVVAQFNQHSVMGVFDQGVLVDNR